MRYLLFAFVIAVSNLSNAQNVLTNFDKVIIEQNFKLDNRYFPQKYNANELLMHENEQYLVQRINPEDYTIAYARHDKDLGNFHLATEITSDGECGIIVHGQRAGNGGIIIELNNSRKYRARKISDGQERILSNETENGWVKSKAINKKGINFLEVKVANGYYDLYINHVFIASFFDLQYASGQCGFFVSGEGSLRANFFKVSIEESLVSNDPDTKDSSKNNIDEDFTEVILLFKTKIDQQQEEINRLESELDKCRSMLNYDTALVSRSEELAAENANLIELIDSTSKALTIAKKRLEYLESFRQDVEEGSNGDLVLNLTSILAEIKKENAKLEQEVNDLQKENADLKKGNDIMLREIDRLKKLLEAQSQE